MSVFARLTEKSWLTPGVDPHSDPESTRPPAAAVGLWTYFGVVIVLFGLITAAYVMRMGGHFGELAHGDDWRSIPKPLLLWLNTAVLFFSSMAFHRAQQRAAKGDDAGLRLSLAAAGALAVLFLAGQIGVWRQLNEAGYFLASGPGFCTSNWGSLSDPIHISLSGNPAVAFFYLITAVHGLHLIGGLAFWGRAMQRSLGGVAAAKLRLSIELCAIYWHFLLLVWLAMFALLLST